MLFIFYAQGGFPHKGGLDPRPPDPQRTPSGPPILPFSRKMPNPAALMLSPHPPEGPKAQGQGPSFRILLTSSPPQPPTPSGYQALALSSLA